MSSLIFAPPGLLAPDAPQSYVDDDTLMSIPDVVEYFDATDASKRTIVDGLVQDCTGKKAGLVLTQPTVARRFTLEAGGLNGQDCFVGTGSHWLTAATPNTWPLGTNQGWIFFVFDNRQPDGSPVRFLCGYGANQPASAGRLLRHTGNGIFQVSAGALLQDGGAGINSGRHVVAGRWGGNGDLMQGYNDGLPTDPPSVTGVGFNTVADKVRIGAGLGANPDGSGMYGAWSHAVVTQGLSPANRDAVLTFLLWKAGRLRL